VSPVGKHFMPGIRLIVTALDEGPDDLFAQLPVDIELVRQIPADERPDCWLARCMKPVRWSADGVPVEVNWWLIGTRAVGQKLSASIDGVGINISYVTDETIISDGYVSWKKCRFVAIGLATSSMVEAGQRPGRRRWWAW
jgi:hypothetical protein